MRVLCCQLKSFGDIIRTFPALSQLKAAYPNLHITYVAFESMRDVFHLTQIIDDYNLIDDRLLELIYDEHCSKSPLFMDLVTKLNVQSFDIYVDFHGVFLSAMIGQHLGINQKVGRTNRSSKYKLEHFYDLAIDFDKEMNRMERHLLMIMTIFPLVTPPIITKTNRQINHLLVCPGSSQLGILKRWHEDNFVSVIKQIIHCKITVCLGPEERDLVSAFSLKNTVVKLCDSFKDYVSLMDAHTLVLSNDTAIAHLSVIKNIQNIVLFGPTSASIHGIWKYHDGANISSPIECLKCDVWKGVCKSSRRCIDGISPNFVVNVINQFMMR